MHHSSHGHHNIRNNYGGLIAAILVLCLLAAAGYALQHTISCFLLSWVIAYLLDPILVKAGQAGVKRAYALILVYIVLSILTVFFMTFMVPMLTINWGSFVRDLPLYILKIKQLAMEWKDRLPLRHGSAEIQWLIDTFSANVDKVAENAGIMVYNFGTRIFFNIFNIVLSPILVFFMLYYKQIIIHTVSSWLPDNRREILISIGNEVNGSIGGYLRGQVIVSIIVGVLASAALYLMDIPHPLFCGIFAGAASILPFIGVVIAVLPALFFAWFKYQAMAILIKIGIVFAVIYFLEGYIVKPLVFKKSMNLNPLVTIIMVMALGELLGFWGILLALPIASAMKIAWGHFINGDFKH
jgi:putative permease